MCFLKLCVCVCRDEAFSSFARPPPPCHPSPSSLFALRAVECEIRRRGESRGRRTAGEFETSSIPAELSHSPDENRRNGFLCCCCLVKTINWKSERARRYAIPVKAFCERRCRSFFFFLRLYRLRGVSPPKRVGARKDYLHQRAG